MMKDDVQDTRNLLLHRLLRDGIMLPLLKSDQQFLSLDRRLAHRPFQFVSDIAIFVLKRDVELQLTRPFQYATFCLRR